MNERPDFGLAALRRLREEEARVAHEPEQRSLLSQVPPDAPYENPDATLHVWDEKRRRWVPWEKWLATAPIVTDGEVERG